MILEWGPMDVKGLLGAIILFWDYKVLEFIVMDAMLFSISCQFKSCENDFD